MRASGVRAAVFAVAVCCIGTGARAQWADAESALLFSGVDLWRNGGSAYVGLLWSPGGLDREGFTMKAVSGAGLYRYRSGDTTFAGLHAYDTMLAGWRFKRSRLDAVVLAGVEEQYHYIVPEDPGNRLLGSTLSPRIAADLWWEPMPEMMASASIGYSTSTMSYYLRAALGWRILDTLYIGPEAQASGDDRYRQLRVGLHATAFKTGPLEWTAAAGFARDSDARSGSYGRLGMHWRQLDPY